MNRTIVLDKHEIVIDRDYYEDLLEFVEVVENALGCTDGDDIRAHIEPELAKVKR